MISKELGRNYAETELGGITIIVYVIPICYISFMDVTLKSGSGKMI